MMPGIANGRSGGAALRKLRAHWRLIAAVCGCMLVCALVAWMYAYLRPDTWRYHTDEIGLRRLARAARPRLVLWDTPAPAPGPACEIGALARPALSPDGATLVFARPGAAGRADLFRSRWDGRAWGAPEPLRALNSPFNEDGPCFSADGRCLYYSTDRPGGRGGYDIWVARWDGAEFAWPMPLTVAVNSRFDEVTPAVSPRDQRLYYASNRPNRIMSRDEERLAAETFRTSPVGQDFDLFAAQRIPAGVTNSAVERALSMLYSLRESALANTNVMTRLGGSAASEAAVDRALAWLARTQETNGSWSIRKSGGQERHDVAATSFALLAFLGRGVRHDSPSLYQPVVARGVRWLTGVQDRLTGDLRGPGPAGNAMYDHAAGALALAEAYGVSKDDDLYSAAQWAADFLVDAQNPDDGGWRYMPRDPGDMSVSGWAILALRSAEMSGIRVPKRTLDGVRKWLKSVGTGRDGGIFVYQPSNKMGSAAMVATGYFCSQLMGLSPNTPQAFETAAFMSASGLRMSDIYFAYYGTLAANQNQGRLWDDWRPAMHAAFARAQERDGSWSAQDNHGRAAGSVICTALVTLCLEAHYRYTPLYGLGYAPPASGHRFARLNGDEVPEVPEFRMGRRLTEINSQRDDIDPAVSPHGDFLYFASARRGGLGGYDLYRARVATGEPQAPRNLGAPVNGPGDERAPALRMNGFNLLYTSRPAGAAAAAMVSALSREVRLEQDYSRRVDPAWFVDTYRVRLGALAAALLGLIYVSFKAGRHARGGPA
jgi:hypothetical protein